MAKSTADKKSLKTGPTSLPAPSSKNFRRAVIGFLALDLAVIMTAMLVLEKMGSISLPGCGPQSACAMAQSSTWGRVSVGTINLPVSFLGLGYFAGMLAAWLISRGRLPAVLRVIAAFAGGISVLFMVVIVSQGHYCPYCIATHLANFVFVGAILKSPGAGVSTLMPLATALLIFFGVNIGAMAAKGKSEATEAQKQESLLLESAKEIAKQAGSTGRTGSTNTLQPAAPDKSDKPWTGPFTGRYRQGPEKAAYRIVLYTDYQCPDCFKVEDDIVQLMKSRSDISLSAKQFPFNKDCNPAMTTTLHGGACWAAQMAEAAGLLSGNDGFWAMHHALFERQRNSGKMQGAFSTREEFLQFVTAMGFPDITAFEQVMQDSRIKAWIKSDCEEGTALGLYYTPMVFINGVELKGIFAPKAVSRTIAALDANKPPAKGPEDDNPPLAPERHVSDWRESPVFRMPVDSMTFGRGPENARIRVAVIGDYQEAGTLEALQELSRLTAGRSDVHMDFRLYPFLRECNPNLPPPPTEPGKPDIPQFPKSCIAARAAKAAGSLGGSDAFWKMHEWLIRNSAAVSLETVQQAAVAIGLDGAQFDATMASPQIQAAIATDANAMRGILNKFGIPTIRINDKIVPRWKLKGDNILERIFKELDKQ